MTSLTRVPTNFYQIKIPCNVLLTVKYNVNHHTSNLLILPRIVKIFVFLCEVVCNSIYGIYFFIRNIVLFNIIIIFLLYSSTLVFFFIDKNIYFIQIIFFNFKALLFNIFIKEFICKRFVFPAAVVGLFNDGILSYILFDI